MHLWITTSILILSIAFLPKTTGAFCPVNPFICGSGVCISDKQRCDGIKDCDDGSDEHSCDCPNNLFACANRKCIPKFWVCDGENDCGDFSDESDCVKVKERSAGCPKGQFSCLNSSVCIPQSWRCDGNADCEDHSDEDETCLREQSLDCFGFKCKSGNCISSSWVCDGFDDCDDKSDELDCDKARIEVNGVWQCSNNYFLCDNATKCIPTSEVCDNITHCFDGSDENDNCGSNDCETMNCSQSCIETERNATCICESGYSLAYDNKTCVDIDECANEDICSQSCTNTLGSYNCSCVPMYEEDGNRCIAYGPGPILIFSTDSNIRSVNLRSRVYSSILENLTHIVGLAYDRQEDRVYYCDVSYKEEAIVSVHMNGTKMRVEVKAGLQVPEDIAIDWTSRTIYLTDSEAKHIAACSMKSDNCHPIVTENIDFPRAIELDVLNRHVFWTDWGSVPYIGRSRLDGSEQEMFVKSEIVWPNGLAIDHVGKRLFWCDGRLQQIDSIGLDKQNRKVALVNIVHHPFSIAVFENTIFWTDWYRYTVEESDLKTGKNHQVLVKVLKKRPMSVHIYHPILQMPSNDYNPCKFLNCSHQCLLKNRTAAVCVCPAGFYLGKNNRTCYENKTATFILFAHGDKLAKFHPQAIGRNVLIELNPDVAMRHISAIAADGRNRLVYIADSHRKKIFSLNLATMTTKVLISSHVSFVRDLALDTLGNNLYWVDGTHKTVEVMSLRTSKRVILYSTNLYPIALTIVQKFGLLFVASRGSDSRIEKMNMDGSERSLLIKITGSMPAALVADVENERLFWTDTVGGKISSVSFKGRSRKIIREKVGRPTSLIKYGNRLYWTDEESQNIFWLTNLKAKNHFLIPFNYSHENWPIPKLALLSFGNEGSSDIRESNHCALNPCSQLCLLTPNYYSCTCEENYVLQPDGTCASIINCFGNHFQCNDKSTCIPSIWVCDGENDCMDKSDEENCTTTCGEDEFKCEESTACIPNLWLCDKQNDCADGSDESPATCENKTCSESDFVCRSGQCVVRFHVCDMDFDCADGSDEEKCEKNTCSNDEFRCESGQCIDIMWACDGDKDCPSGNDESEDMCKKIVRCHFDEFECNNSLCIPFTFKCNGVDECGDNSDEYQCKNYKSTTCRNGMFRCNANGKCISIKSRCDGERDCPDGEDEDDCFEKCEDDYFLCREKVCISRKWLCDGTEDCEDGEDESAESCGFTSTSITSLTSDATGCANKDYLTFTCKNGICIPMDYVCDGKADCPDQSDEDINCYSACVYRNGGCEHFCTGTVTGTICSCFPGFRLNADNRTCSDINECDSNPCSQICTNTNGGFTCSCVDGYRLSSDRIRCKATGILPKLLVVHPSDITSLSIDHSHLFRVLKLDNCSIQSVDFDFRNDFVYWSCSSGIYRSKSRRRSIQLVLETRKNCGKIAIDWMAQNLYYIESDNTINILPLASNETIMKMIVLSFHKNITSIALDPNEKILFWSVKSNTIIDDGRIYRSQLTGEMRKPVTDIKLVKPNNLALDFVAKRIYWADPFLSRIESCTYYGKDRRIVMHMAGRPTSLAVFEDSIYWSANFDDMLALVSCNKTKCDRSKVLYKDVVGILDLKIFHNVQQPISSATVCKPNSCAHICVPTTRSFICLCSELTVFALHSSNRCIIPLEMCALHCGNDADCVVTNNTIECRCPLGFTGKMCDIKLAITEVERSNITPVVLAVVFSIIILVCLAAGICYCFQRSRNEPSFAAAWRALRHNKLTDHLPVVRFSQPRSWIAQRTRNGDSDREAILNDKDFNNPAFQPMSPTDEEEGLRNGHSKVKLSLYQDEDILTSDNDRQRLIS